MHLSRRNLLYGLGAMGASVALPMIQGCRSRAETERTPGPINGVEGSIRFLLEGAWVLRRGLFASNRVLAMTPLLDNQRCSVGQWSNGAFAGLDTKGCPMDSGSPFSWSADLYSAQQGEYQLVVPPAFRAARAPVIGAEFSMAINTGTDILLDLPCPSSVALAGKYVDAALSHSCYVVTALIYDVGTAGVMALHTSKGDIWLQSGADMIFRLRHPDPAGTPPDPVRVRANARAIEERFTDPTGTHPALGMGKLTSTNIDNNTYASFSELELGLASPTTATACVLTLDATLSNGIGSSVAVEGGTQS